MTCIVAIIENGVPYFAADSFVGNMPGPGSNEMQTIRKEPKIWVKDGMVFGGNGDTRMLQLLHYMHETPLYTTGQNKVKYLVNQFIPSLQECLAQNKHPDDGLEGSILLAIESELFTIGGDFRVCNTADLYETVGKAGKIAIGSLHATEQLGIPVLQRLWLALKSTQRHTCVVEEPFHFITSEMDEAKPLVWHKSHEYNCE